MTNRVARVLATLLLASGCGGGTNTPTAPAVPAPAPSPTPTPRNLRGDVTDPVGDTGRSTPDLLVPDLRSGSIEITNGNLMVISVRCAPGTFDPAITHFQIELDTDQNPGTGNAFFGLGLEYIVNLGSAYYAAGAEVLRHIGDGQYVRVSTVPVTVVADGMDVAIPLALVGNDDGRLNFRVAAASYLGGNAFTAILDFMPDRDAPGAVVQ